MSERLTQMAAKCKKRGGDCPCIGDCLALKRAYEEQDKAHSEIRRLQSRLYWLELVALRLQSLPATLRSDFTFDTRYTPVMVFGGGDGQFGYEDGNGDWIDCNEWPFNEEYVFPDDCERFGIRVE